MDKVNIAIIGLGYVGLPLAVEFSKKYNVIGFDINQSKINSLHNGVDYTNEITDLSLLNSPNIKFTNNQEFLLSCNIFIITVPTPIDKFKEPDLIPLIKSSELVSKYLKKNDIVIYESTVYPGCTEEVCVPILEKKSKLKYNTDFFCGYSPERINPGDKINTLTKIKKVTSGSNESTANFINKLYSSIITAGTYMASSIKVAEASKAIENAQRDLNIAFVNELSIIFNLMGIDTNEVLEAAKTKWNFLDFKPGLVGGHCIGVDPYYLAHKAKACGYHPDVILTGRRVNDAMGIYVANRVVKLLNNINKIVAESNVLIIGFAFKENCNDVRNTKVIDIYNELIEFGLNVDIYDPLVNENEVKKEYGINIIQNPTKYDAIVYAVPHEEFANLNFNNLKKSNISVVFDLKSMLAKNESNGRL